MATIQRLTVYKTYDGKIFDSLEMAEAHETKQRIVDTLEATEDIYWRETCAEEVVEFMLRHYTITPKG